MSNAVNCFSNHRALYILRCAAALCIVPVFLSAATAQNYTPIPDYENDPDCAYVNTGEEFDMSGLNGTSGGKINLPADCGSVSTSLSLTAISGDNPSLQIPASPTTAGLDGNGAIAIKYDGLSGTSIMVYEFSQAVDVTITFSSNHRTQEPVTLTTPYSSVIEGSGSGFLSGSNTVGNPHVWQNGNSASGTKFTWLNTKRIELGIKGVGLTQTQVVETSEFYSCACNPSITVVKTADVVEYATVGETINYQYYVENTGNIQISDLTLTDDKLGVITCPITTLERGETTSCAATHVVLQADLDAGFITNTVIADGTPSAETLTPAQDTVSVTSTTLTASLAMTKTANSVGPYTAGDMITYTYTVTNDGFITVRDIAISDSHNGSGPAPVPTNETLTIDNGVTGNSTDASNNGSWDALAPGDVVTFTGTYTVTQIDAENL